MTTTVHISIKGNKACTVTTQAGKTLLQPGAHHEFLVHGEGEITVKEHGEFLTAPALPLVQPFADKE